MSKSLAERISELAPTDEKAISGAAIAVARQAAAAPSSGRKSLALLRRHALAKAVRVDVVDQVIAMAEAEFERLMREATSAGGAEVPAVPWFTVEATADALGESVARIRTWLRSVDGRRRLGWPWWDGHQWRIPEPAVNPMTRPAYMATLPDEEPPAHARTLPRWCETMSGAPSRPD